jgi:hypothetical protein
LLCKLPTASFTDRSAADATVLVRTEAAELSVARMRVIAFSFDLSIVLGAYDAA